MSHHPLIEMEEPDNRRQEQRELEMWLNEREKEMEQSGPQQERI